MILRNLNQNNNQGHQLYLDTIAKFILSFRFKEIFKCCIFKCWVRQSDIYHLIKRKPKFGDF